MVAWLYFGTGLWEATPEIGAAAMKIAQTKQGFLLDRPYSEVFSVIG